MIWHRETQSLFKAEWKSVRYMVSGDSHQWMLIVQAGPNAFQLVATGTDRLELIQHAEDMSADDGEG